jgi:hypothetical protein
MRALAGALLSPMISTSVASALALKSCAVSAIVPRMCTVILFSEPFLRPVLLRVIYCKSRWVSWASSRLSIDLDAP